MNLAFILYSHSSLSWIWQAFIKEQEEYFPIDCNKYIFADKASSIPEDNTIVKIVSAIENTGYEYIEYLNDWPYAERMLKCLSQIDEEFVLFHHEDMIFYDAVDMDMFEYYLLIMNQNPQFAYLKLLRGGTSPTAPQPFASGIYHVQEDELYRFAVQPAIWRKSALESILTACIENNIYQLEEFASQYIQQNNIQALFAYNEGEDSKRGLYHWDNSKYPYIATALIKGKWNDYEYDMEVANLKSRYNL